jgi:hypothetical protein
VSSELEKAHDVRKMHACKSPELTTDAPERRLIGVAKDLERDVAAPLDVTSAEHTTESPFA